MAGFSASFGVGFEAFVVCGDLKLILSFSFRLVFFQICFNSAYFFRSVSKVPNNNKNKKKFRSSSSPRPTA